MISSAAKCGDFGASSGTGFDGVDRNVRNARRRRTFDWRSPWVFHRSGEDLPPPDLTNPNATTRPRARSSVISPLLPAGPAHPSDANRRRRARPSFGDGPVDAVFYTQTGTSA